MSSSSSSRVNGLASFAAVAFAVALVVIAALERVGAPAGFVRALGPVAALLGAVVIGLGARTANLAMFAAAGRAVAPLYAALAFAAVAAGLALALLPLISGDGELPRLAFVAGLALAGLATGPILRAFGAASPSDVVATRFAGTSARLLAALVLTTCGALTALAGFELAVDVLVAFGTADRRWAEAIVGATLFLTAAPGGLAGVVWGGAASGGAIAIILALAAGVGWFEGLQPLPDPQALVAPFLTLPPMSETQRLASEAATALAVGCAFALTPTAAASPTARSGLAGGALGLVAALGLAALAVGVLALFPADLASGAAAPTRAAWFGAATLLATLALARSGLVGMARAFGVPIGVAEGPFPPLASVRLARMRLAMLAALVGCAALSEARAIDPPTAIVGALALSLALIAPLLALSAIPRVGSAAAAVSMLVGLGALAYGALATLPPPGPGAILRQALVAALAAFAAGLVASLVATRRAPLARRSDFDPFADPQS